MLETTSAQSLLSLDSDLGEFLSHERLEMARRQLWVRVVALDSDVWQPDDVPAFRNAGDIGLLVVSGVIVRELCVHDAPSAELFGPGDVIRAPQSDDQLELLPTVVRWTPLERAVVALLDGNCALVLRRFPEIMTVVLDRFNARAERLAVTQAISQITGVETRVEAVLWHLAERWGRVASDGVIVALGLSHRMIGSLVGARRATVSTAIARLGESERLMRRPDGTWLLTGCQPSWTNAVTADSFAAGPAARVAARADGRRDRRGTPAARAGAQVRAQAAPAQHVAAAIREHPANVVAGHLTPLAAGEERACGRRRSTA